MTYKEIEKEAIYITRHGSWAYGLNTPESAIDIKGVFIPPPEYYLGFLHTMEQVESKNPNGVIYEIRKFFTLASNCNPTIIEVLYTEESDILQTTHLGKVLRANRDSFLSQKARFTFSDYAYDQLDKIERHRNRTKEGHKLESKHSYNTKHAMHLVRLLCMAEEVLKKGEVRVKRTADKTFLLAVREGVLTYEELVKWAKEKNQELEKYYLSGKSPLPKFPDKEALDELCVAMVSEYHCHN